jgi:hypothetical protein
MHNEDGQCPFLPLLLRLAGALMRADQPTRREKRFLCSPSSWQVGCLHVLHLQWLATKMQNSRYD